MADFDCDNLIVSVQVRIHTERERSAFIRNEHQNEDADEITFQIILHLCTAITDNMHKTTATQATVSLLCNS